MDAEDGENEVKKETQNVVTADLSPHSPQEVISPNTVSRQGGVPAGIHTSDQECMNVPEEDAPDEDEEAATSDPEENVTPTEDLAVKINDHAVSHQESVVSEIDDDGPPRLQLETPEREKGYGTEGGEPAAAHVEKEDINHEEHMQLLRELCEDRDKASRRSSHLQMKLAEHFAKAGDGGLLEGDLPESEQLREYKKNINILTELKQQLNTDSGIFEQQTEELSLQCQEKQDKVGLIARICARPRIWQF